MIKQAQNAKRRYLKRLAKALRNAPLSIKSAAAQDIDEFLSAESQAIDVSRLNSETEAMAWFVERLGTPEHLAANYHFTRDRTNKMFLTSLRWALVPCCIALFFILTSNPIANVQGKSRQDFERLSPFTKVVFDGDVVLVDYDNKTWHWMELNEISVKKIVESAKDQFGDRWKKRISEDLVEVLDGMNHRPGETVSLTLVDPKTKDSRFIENAVMTYENRRAVWRFNNRDVLETMTTLPPRELGKLQADPFGYFHKQLQSRWAYYSHSKNRIDSAIEELKKSNINILDNNLVRIELQKALAKGIDGHASINNWRLPGRCLPFLIESIGQKYIAFNADRKSFIDTDHPYIESIDGISISDWCEASSALVAKGSPQLVQSRSIRLLRHIDYWREVFALPTGGEIELKLVSLDGQSSISKKVKTVERKPLYRHWPRAESKLENGIGYLRIDSMDSRAVSSIRNWMPKFRDANGLIVDVRGNGGGSRDALRWLFSYLMSPADSPRAVNAAKYRLHKDFPSSHLEARFMYVEESDHWCAEELEAIAKFAEDFNPQWQPDDDEFSEWHYMVLNRLDHDEIFYFDQPVVILLDNGCFSATDVFLAALKGWRNVTLVGTPSSGGSARSVSLKIPGLVDARLASMASFQPDGNLYDGNGVHPDVVIEPSPDFFIGGEDKALTKAIELIEP